MKKQHRSHINTATHIARRNNSRYTSHIFGNPKNPFCKLGLVGPVTASEQFPSNKLFENDIMGCFSSTLTFRGGGRFEFSKEPLIIGSPTEPWQCALAISIECPTLLITQYVAGNAQNQPHAPIIKLSNSQIVKFTNPSTQKLPTVIYLAP